MTSVIDVVLESMKTPTPATTEVSGKKIGDTRKVVTASAASAHAEAGPSGVFRKSPHQLLPKHLPRVIWNTLLYTGKKLSSDQIAEVQHYAKEFKYPQGTLVYGGDNEDDFLYCIPDSKEINVCREMMDNMGYPKLELGLSAMTKDQLADSFAYNSLKVCTFWLHIHQFLLQ
jgi:hypothetical protein